MQRPVQADLFVPRIRTMQACRHERCWFEPWCRCALQQWPRVAHSALHASSGAKAGHGDGGLACAMVDADERSREVAKLLWGCHQRELFS